MIDHPLPKPPMIRMLTQNIAQLRQEVAAHVAADTIIQKYYWDDHTQSGCFIGCLAKGNNPMLNEITYGLPVMLQRIAENIFEQLPAADAKAFFAALPEAINCDGKDLTRVVWQFLAANLRSLNCPAQIQIIIDPVITGMDLLASGQEYVNAADDAASNAAWIDDVANAAWADDAATYAAWAAAYAAIAANVDDTASSAAWAADVTAHAADANDYEVIGLQQRDLLLRLISEAHVVKAHQ